MNEKEKELILHVGRLIRGDWSGGIFDGRDVLHWLERICSGEDIEEELNEIDKEYE